MGRGEPSHDEFFLKGNRPQTKGALIPVSRLLSPALCLLAPDSYQPIVIDAGPTDVLCWKCPYC